nr:glycoside hydrolase family 70 protein [Leuconostoc falkenbergense]
MFKSWGVTSFQMAPQYRSSTDTSFLDSIIQNGYAAHKSIIRNIFYLGLN